MTITAPDYSELAQLCDFAETRLNQLAGVDPNYVSAEEDGPSPWEWGCLTKTREWLSSLQEMNGAKKIEMALEILEEEGVVEEGAVERIVTISTAHITEYTAQAIESALQKDKQPFGLVVFAKGEYGWLIWLPPPEDDSSTAEVPDELDNAMNYARSLGCTWLVIDRDGDKTHALSEFDW